MESQQILTFVLFILGFVLLVKGADLLVDGSSTIARRLGIPGMVIGLTIVAFGTSLPELVVNVISTMQGNTDIGLGNVVGSNIINILVILGVTSVIYPLAIDKNAAKKDTPFSIIITILLIITVNANLIGLKNRSEISAVDGIIFLVILAGYLYYLLVRPQSTGKKEPDINTQDQESSLPAVEEKKELLEQDESSHKPYWKLVLMILAGIIALCFGGRWVVDGALIIARKFGLSEILISVTIVALGTSLPELVTSIVAALRKEADISVGNIVGSNILNILFILGVSSLIKPLPMRFEVNYDLLVVLGSTIFLYIVMKYGRQKYTIERWEGILMLIGYAGYTVYVILRG